MINYIKANKILFLLIVVYTAFNISLVNVFFPITEGWFNDYSRYMMEGKVPYRDFYVMIPPGYIYLNLFLEKIFGDTFIFYRIFGITERMLLLILVYNIFTKIFKKEILFFPILTAFVVYISNFQDVFYGYYQSSFLFACIVLFTVIKIIENYDTECYTYLWACMFGASSALSFIFKQTIGGLLPIILGLAFVFLTIRKDWKKTIKIGFVSLFIAFFSLIIIAIILHYNEAFYPFLDQMINGSQSKGSLKGIFFGFIPRIITLSSLKIFVLFFSIVLGKYIYKITDNNIIHRAIGISTIIGVNIILFVLILRCFIYDEITKNIFIGIILVALIIISTDCKILNKINFISIMSVLLLLSFAYIFNNEITFFDYMRSRNFRQHILYSIFWGHIFYLIKYIYLIYFKQVGLRDEYCFVIVCASFAMMYTHGLSFIIEDHGMLLAIVLVLGGMFTYKIYYDKIKNLSLVLLCFFTILSIYIQRVNYPYNWWGVNTLPPIYLSKYEYKDPNLKYMLGDKDTVNTMNEVYDLINHYKKEGDTLYTFPHINYFNVMAKMDSPTFAKVHYFDVCPDFIVQRDIEILRNNPPRFVFIQDFDDYEWDFHEKVFRMSRRSEQRKILNLFQNEIENGKYITLKIFNVHASHPIRILYRIDDGY